MKLFLRLSQPQFLALIQSSNLKSTIKITIGTQFLALIQSSNLKTTIKITISTYFAVLKRMCFEAQFVRAYSFEQSYLLRKTILSAIYLSEVILCSSRVKLIQLNRNSSLTNLLCGSLINKNTVINSANRYYNLPLSIWGCKPRHCAIHFHDWSLCRRNIHPSGF